MLSYFFQIKKRKKPAKGIVLELVMDESNTNKTEGVNEKTRGRQARPMEWANGHREFRSCERSGSMFPWARAARTGQDRTGQQRDNTGPAGCAHEITSIPQRISGFAKLSKGSMVSSPEQLEGFLGFGWFGAASSVRNDYARAHHCRTARGPLARQRQLALLVQRQLLKQSFASVRRYVRAAPPTREQLLCRSNSQTVTLPS